MFMLSTASEGAFHAAYIEQSRHGFGGRSLLFFPSPCAPYSHAHGTMVRMREPNERWAEIPADERGGPGYSLGIGAFTLTITPSECEIWDTGKRIESFDRNGRDDRTSMLAVEDRWKEMYEERMRWRERDRRSGDL